LVDVNLSGSARRIGALKELFGVHLVYSMTSSEWGGYDESADGKRVLVDMMDETPAAEPVNLIVNWDAELKKRLWRRAWRFFRVEFPSYQWASDGHLRVFERG
jgi:hypothetical protein